MKSFHAESSDRGMSRFRRFRRHAIFFAVLSLALTASDASGQGTFNGFDVVRTGEGNGPVVSVWRTGLIPSADTPSLRFTFGFATDETTGVGQFPDSVTATFQAADDPAAAAVVVTVDVHGPLWAPPSEGALPLTAGSIQHQVIEFPSLTPVPANRWAYDVSFLVPAALLDRPVNFYLDLFDNDVGGASLAWVGAIHVVPVPEPGAAALVLTGMAAWFLRKPFRR